MSSDTLQEESAGRPQPVRDILQVIDAMRLFIPPTEQELLKHLKGVYYSAAYAAPELQKLRWVQLQEVLIDYFRNAPPDTPEWQKTVLCLFSNTPRHAIDAQLVTPTNEAPENEQRTQHGGNDQTAEESAVVPGDTGCRPQRDD